MTLTDLTNKGKNMNTFATTKQIVDNEVKCPIDISVIPNFMGINLCSVEGIGWHRRPDNQLTELTVLFNPDRSKDLPGMEDFERTVVYLTVPVSYSTKVSRQRSSNMKESIETSFSKLPLSQGIPLSDFTEFINSYINPIT